MLLSNSCYGEGPVMLGEIKRSDSHLESVRFTLHLCNEGRKASVFRVHPVLSLFDKR